MNQIPNLLCLLRVALAPWSAWLIVEHDYRKAFLVFAVAAWSDFFDGLLARKMNWYSPFGAYLDPAADKLLMVTTYVALGIAGAVPWWLVVLIFGRDVVILAGAAILYGRLRQTRFPPSMAGKVSTTLQLCAVVVVMWVEGGYLPEWMRHVAIFTTAAGTAYSGFDYVRRGWHVMIGV